MKITRQNFNKLVTVGQWGSEGLYARSVEKQRSLNRLVSGGFLRSSGDRYWITKAGVEAIRLFRSENPS